jgi:type I restriction enzyme M protein
MRKDKGLTTDLDRLPMLTWILFLKFLDDLEQVRETEALLEGSRFQAAVEPPYRWRDWAAKADGITGEALINFIQNDEAQLPDGKRGPGLFAYLRTLQGRGESDRRDVIRTVFESTTNRMRNGYLLRDVINKVNEIHFTSSAEIYTLGHIYESMLKEMRDAAGENGEFYTPRPLVKFIVGIVNPRLGEKVLDPAAGTGGFLAEAFEHLKAQCKTAEDQQKLQQDTLFGIEAKPLPFLLCQMNLLLHGIESPDIDPHNALRHRLREIGDEDRVDVIVTNPPFGGEEERSVLGNFPEDKQTTETALLFLQVIMRRLRRQPRPGRAAVVVPDGVLAADGVAARIKEELLNDFNLHTVVRLPSGVFAPYTTIPSNVIFFDRSRSSGDVWYYEHALPVGRKTYTKTQPLQLDEFEPLRSWWTNRQENDRAWKISAQELMSNGCNLDCKNPLTLKEDHSVALTERTAILAGNAESVSADTLVVLREDTWRKVEIAHDGEWTPVRLGDALQEVVSLEDLAPDRAYGLLGVRLAGEGPFLRETKLGAEISAVKLNRVSQGVFIYSRLFAWRGAFGLVPADLDGCYASNEFPTYRIISSDVIPEYLRLYFTRPAVWQAVEKKCQGTTKASRNRFKEEFLLDMTISVPRRDIQEAIVSLNAATEGLAERATTMAASLGRLSVDALTALYRDRL